MRVGYPDIHPDVGIFISFMLFPAAVWNVWLISTLVLILLIGYGGPSLRSLLVNYGIFCILLPVKVMGYGGTFLLCPLLIMLPIYPLYTIYALISKRLPIGKVGSPSQ